MSDVCLCMLTIHAGKACQESQEKHGWKSVPGGELNFLRTKKIVFVICYWHLKVLPIFQAIKDVVGFDGKPLCLSLPNIIGHWVFIGPLGVCALALCKLCWGHKLEIIQYGSAKSSCIRVRDLFLALLTVKAFRALTLQCFGGGLGDLKW